jgi:hypothetical protein
VSSLHPDLEHLGILVGTWTGEGTGRYPTIDDFAYGETVTFGHVGKPFLAYQQRTWRPADRFPLHAEVGYWRPVGPSGLEVVLAHPTGVTEGYEGTVVVAGAGRLEVELVTTVVTCTPTAKRVDALRRRIVVDGDRLEYELHMAAVGVPMTHHLSAVLHRQAAG